MNRRLSFVGVICLTLVGGCGTGGIIAAETARATACIAVQERILREFERNGISQEQALGRFQCTVAVCDELHSLIMGGDDVE